MAPLRFLIALSVIAAGCGRVGFDSSSAQDGGTTFVDAFVRLGDADAQDAGDGLDAGAPSRVLGAVVLYLFNEGSGDQVIDQGPDPKANLTVMQPSAVTWGASELSINTATRIVYPPAAMKLIDACQATNEITIEAWVTPEQTSQSGPARIVTLTMDARNHNFLLGQETEFYQARLRTTTTDANGSPLVSSLAGTATTTLTHVVFTHNAAEGNDRLFVNGSFVGANPRTGTFDAWDPTYRLVVGNDLTDGRPWLGTLHLIAVYDRALSPAEVLQNFQAGPD